MDMETIFKESNELTFLARAAGKDESDFTTLLIVSLSRIGLPLTEMDWGQPMSTAVDDYHDEDLREALRETGIDNVTKDVWLAFLELVPFGDGECPYCGGEQEIVSEDKEQISDGYLNPPEYRIKYQEKKCINCGMITELWED